MFSYIFIFSYMPEMHLRQPEFTYSACGLFTKNKEIIRFKETGDLRYIYQNELDKASFQHDMTYGDFKDLNTRAAADKVLCDKALNIAKDPKYNGYQRGLASMVCQFFNSNNQRKLNKRKVHSLIDNTVLRVIDIYSKYAWVIPLKDKKGITITNDFQKTLDESNPKPNKIWVDKGS